jgi:predicted ATPase
MLTRIEIDGFKTFEEFKLDLDPFVVILGPNASGKSNLFDAIRLLSRLAGNDVRTAVKDSRGDLEEIFRKAPGSSPTDRISLAAEVLLHPRVRDPWGASVSLTHTRIRYEVVVEKRRSESNGVDRLVVAKESARPILSADDSWSKERQKGIIPHRKAHFRYARRSPFLSTSEESGKAVFEIHQDGQAGRKRSAQAAEATVLSSITTAEQPHLFALREELKSWRFLQLDPGALRRPSPFDAPEVLQPDGSNLAGVLARIQAETGTAEHTRGCLSMIGADLARLIQGVTGVEVKKDEGERRYQVNILFRDGAPFSSRVASDGTLRVLALLTALNDPKHQGLLCFEEPENGVHPGRLKNLIHLLRDTVTSPRAIEIDVDEPEPMSQMLLNSHSPVVLSAMRERVQEGAAVLFSDIVTVTDPETGTGRRKTRLRRVTLGEQTELFEESREFVTRIEVERYLGEALSPG